jgi:hypothetical protein
MTKRKAFELTIEIWAYLAEHPEINDKADLPEELYKEIKRLTCRCPLCAYYKMSCGRCILPSIDWGKCLLFSKWQRATSKRDRSRAARKIVTITQKALDELLKVKQ